MTQQIVVEVGPNALIDVEVPSSDIAVSITPIGMPGSTGEPGPIGDPGPKGDPGNTGPGVAAGGDDGAVLVKTSTTNYATGWLNTTTFGRTLLGLANAAALRMAAELPIATTVGRLARYIDDAGVMGETASIYEQIDGKVGVDVGESGLDGNAPAMTISGGGGQTTSIQLLLKNTREGAGQYDDYENEVHLALQAGVSGNHRRYLNFRDYAGTDRWLTGVNASNVWIQHDSSEGGGHRLWFESTAGTAPLNTGNSYISATGSGAVIVNGGNNDGDTTGTGGFRVDAGGTYPRKVLLKVSQLTATDAALQVDNNGAGYAPASLLLKALQSTLRGAGIFLRNELAQKSWFSGIQHNSNGDTWSINYAGQVTWDPIVASATYPLFTVKSDGRVGIGNNAPSANLHVGGNATDTNTQISVAVKGIAHALFRFVDDAVEKGQVTYNSAGYMVLSHNESGVSVNNTDLVLRSGLTGLGTNSPQKRLSVATTGDAIGLSVGDAGNATGKTVDIGFYQTSDYGRIQSVHAGSGFKTLALNPSGGNVGVGTTNPGSTLEVNGNVSLKSGYSLYHGAGVLSGYVGPGSSIFSPAQGVADLGVRSPAGNLHFSAASAAPQMILNTSGNVGIGTLSPVTPLDVNGPIRCKSYTVATVPSAAVGSAQQIYVADESGGAVLAFSDGTSWRRVTDRAVIS